MPNLNRVQLMGNMTRDPEVRQTPKGMSVCKIAIAINRAFKTENGEKKEEVTFVDAVAFGKKGEVIAEYFRKGNPIYIEGRLRLETWEDKETQKKRSQLGVVIDGFEFLAPRTALAPAEDAPKTAQPLGDEVPF